MPQSPAVELQWPDHREQLVADTTLAMLPSISTTELDATLSALRDFERELSDLRTQLHGVIDRIDRAIVDRRVAGSAG